MTTEGIRDQTDDAPSQEAPLEESAVAAPPPRDTHWWGETAVDVDRVVRAVAGPLTLWAHRKAREWSIVTAVGDDSHAGAAERGHEVPEDDIAEGGTRRRFSFSESPAALIIRPAVADRPVVVRPESPLAVPSGERVTLFVSTPVWLSVSVGRASRARRRRGRGKPAARRDEDALEDVRLFEIPTFRLSDTWFGPSTLVGDLCYASRTAGRLALEELPIRPHRAVTAVTIDNRAASALVIQRVLVPVPTLALYAAQDGALWTQSVTLTRYADVDGAITRVDGQEPSVLRGPTERLAEPREAVASGSMVRAFSRLFRGGEGQAS